MKEYKIMIKTVRNILLKLGKISLEPKKAQIYVVAKLISKLSKLTVNELLSDESDRRKFEQIDHLIIDYETQLKQEGLLTPVYSGVEKAELELEKIEDEEIDIIRNSRNISKYLADASELVQKISDITNPEDRSHAVHLLALTLISILHALEIDVKKDKDIMKHLKHINLAFKEHNKMNPMLKGYWRNEGQERFVEEIMKELK